MPQRTLAGFAATAACGSECARKDLPVVGNHAVENAAERHGPLTAASSIEAWLRTTAAELGGSHRSNAVSPTVLTESLTRPVLARGRLRGQDQRRDPFGLDRAVPRGVLPDCEGAPLGSVDVEVDRDVE